MKLSIIIPVYNAAGYLHNTLIQLLENCENSQIILVNDGSTDKSEVICQEFSQLDNRVKVITQSNRGPGAARNTGIQYATGEWIYFMDADDSITTGGFEFLKQLHTVRNIDLLVFGFRVVSTVNDIIKFPNCRFDKTKFGSYLQKYFLEIPYGNGFLWNKIYRREIIISNNIQFDTDIRVQEDEIFNLNYLRCCHSVELHDIVLYNYNIATPTNSRTRYLGNYFKCIEKVHNSFERIFCEFLYPIPPSLYSRTLQAIMVNELLFYFLHEDNPMTDYERCKHLRMIGESDVYQHSIDKVTGFGKMPFEWSCYHQAVKRGSLRIFKFWYHIFSTLRGIKHTISR